MGLLDLFKKKHKEINHEEKDTFVCLKCKRELEKKYLHNNDMCAECYNVSETKKVRTEKVTEATLSALRKKIIESINERPAMTYQLASLLWKDAAACFTDYSLDGAWFYLNLNTMELYAQVSTYPNQFGAYREGRYSLNASEFHQKAIKFQFPIELQEMKTEADWKALFNGELKSAVENAKKILEEQEKQKKEKERIANAVVIPDDFQDRKPTMEFNEIELELQQRYGWTKIILIKESEKYILKYTSAHYGTHKRELSAIEAAWLEQQVNDCMKNKDQTTWQSLPGGDMMTVKIYKNCNSIVELIREKPLKKYYDLQNSLRKLVSYGSLTETEAKKIKG